MADVGNISFWPTEPLPANVTDMTNYELHLKAFNVPVTWALSIIMFIICLVGLVGNGLLLWFLFKIQQNHCVVYVINLAIADTTYLVGYFIWTVVLICLQSGLQGSSLGSSLTFTVGGILNDIGFNTSIFVLAAISMERCLSVLSPMWYHRRRLKRQCIIVCVLLWALSCLVMVLDQFVSDYTVEYPYPGSETRTAVYLFTSALYLLAVILMIISSVTLLIEIQKTSKQCHPLRLHIITLLTVLIFHLTVVPTMVLGLLLNFKVLQSDAFKIAFSYIFVSEPIYFCANSYVYIFVGMWNRHCSRRSIQQALENVFKEETESSIQRQELSS